MIGLVFDPTPARLLVAGVASRLSRTGALGPGTPLRLRELGDPPLPGPDWVELRPAWCGVCGSDVHQACLDADVSNPLSAIVAFPHVMGHEVVARDPGDRLVVVDPWLGCEALGEEPCASCAAGHGPLCDSVTAGAGMHLGNMPRLPGGFSTRMVAHRSQVHPIPEGLDPRAAVLADPLAVAWHSVERAAPDPGRGPVVVMGAGTIGLSVTAVLRWRLPAARVVVTAAWPHTKAEVEALGATAVEPGGIVEAVAGLTGETPIRPWRGRPWLREGAAAVIDTVGSVSTLADSLRVAGRRARVAVVGIARAGRFDPTLAYIKEVEVAGSNGYGRDAIPAVLAMLVAGHVPYRRWLTHEYPLAQWRRAFATARRPGRSRSIKVLLEVSP